MMLLGLIVLGLMLFYAARTTKRLILSTEKNERMESELYIASAIQMAMLPKVFPPFADRPDLNIHGLVEPAKEVGGDLYDFYVRHDKLFFCIGDVSGKGVPASLVMAMTRSLFRTISSHEENAETIVKAMNSALTEQNTQNMFLTFFVGVLDCQTGMLEYCNAGHNAPVLMVGGEWRMLPVIPNIPLGIDANYPYAAQTTQMKHSDLLFLYTDGLTEAENSAHKLFGDERMMQSLATIPDTCPRKVIEHMQSAVTAFVAGAEQSDDLTMLAIRYQYPALIMRNDIQQIPTLAEWIEGLGVPEELNMPINLALEEAVTNVMLYAYPGQHGSVLVEFAQATDPQTAATRLIFTITDSGVPFDPTQRPEADISSSAEEREIGGLGIHLVRQIMSEVRYERKEDKNVLTLIKNL
jgi:sigma-B regulation protein RsbU (phosphoserine phosphatase)